MMQAALWEEKQEEKEAKDIKSKLKSQEEIDKFTVDDKLSELDRSLLFLKTGLPIQRTAVLTVLPRLVQAGGNAAADVLLPLILKILPRADPTAVTAACTSYEKMIQDKIVSDPTRINNVILPTLFAMLDLDSAETAEAWLSPLQLLLPQLHREVVATKVATFTLTKGDVSQPLHSRIICCKLIGLVAPLMSSTHIEQKIFPKAMSLCQDTEGEVRQCMCAQLNALARAVGLNLTKNVLMGELFELIKDEEINVKVQALTSLVALLDYLPQAMRQKQAIPSLQKLCVEPQSPNMMLAVAKLFGDFMFKIAGDISKEESKDFYDFYKKLALLPDVESRRLGAYNLPAVLKSIGKSNYAEHLHDSFLLLVKDADVSVRKTIASGFHEVATIIGRDRALKLLKDPFLALLKDVNLDVRIAVTDHLDKILEQFRVPDDNAERAYGEIMPALLQFEQLLKNTWRPRVRLFEQAIQFPLFFKPQLLAEKFIPVIIENMHEGTRPVKQLHKRTELCSRIIREFCQSRTCWDRILFVEVCQHLLTIFSRRWFKEHMLEACLDTALDRVPNVRMKMCVLLPQLKRVVRIPTDNSWLERISNSLTRLMADKDKDVAVCAAKAAEELAKIEVRSGGPTGVGGSIGGTANSGGASALSLSQQDADDVQREKEENDLVEQEERDIEDSKKRIGDDYATKFGHSKNKLDKKSGSKTKLLSANGTTSGKKHSRNLSGGAGPRPAGAGGSGKVATGGETAGAASGSVSTNSKTASTSSKNYYQSPVPRGGSGLQMGGNTHSRFDDDGDDDDGDEDDLSDASSDADTRSQNSSSSSGSGQSGKSNGAGNRRSSFSETPAKAGNGNSNRNSGTATTNSAPVNALKGKPITSASSATQPPLQPQPQPQYPARSSSTEPEKGRRIVNTTMATTPAIAAAASAAAANASAKAPIYPSARSNGTFVSPFSNPNGVTNGSVPSGGTAYNSPSLSSTLYRDPAKPSTNSIPLSFANSSASSSTPPSGNTGTTATAATRSFKLLSVVANASAAAASSGGPINNHNTPAAAASGFSTANSTGMGGGGGGGVGSNLTLSNGILTSANAPPNNTSPTKPKTSKPDKPRPSVKVVTDGAVVGTNGNGTLNGNNNNNNNNNSTTNSSTSGKHGGGSAGKQRHSPKMTNLKQSVGGPGGSGGGVSGGGVGGNNSQPIGNIPGRGPTATGSSLMGNTSNGLGGGMPPSKTPPPNKPPPHPSALSVRSSAPLSTFIGSNTSILTGVSGGNAGTSLPSPSSSSLSSGNKNQSLKLAGSSSFLPTVHAPRRASYNENEMKNKLYNVTAGARH